MKKKIVPLQFVMDEPNAKTRPSVSAAQAGVLPPKRPPEPARNPCTAGHCFGAEMDWIDEERFPLRAELRGKQGS
ncbi:MAG: hypothetical protein EHM61_27255 [Acidobacteria bacterium]|nr:MAG: hypothetical protein EHM61_27255 [Acidobacteriota bacterium]